MFREILLTCLSAASASEAEQHRSLRRQDSHDNLFCFSLKLRAPVASCQRLPLLQCLTSCCFDFPFIFYWLMDFVVFYGPRHPDVEAGVLQLDIPDLCSESKLECIPLTEGEDQLPSFRDPLVLEVWHTSVIYNTDEAQDQHLLQSHQLQQSWNPEVGVRTDSTGKTVASLFDSLEARHHLLPLGVREPDWASLGSLQSCLYTSPSPVFLDQANSNAILFNLILLFGRIFQLVSILLKFSNFEERKCFEIW